MITNDNSWSLGTIPNKSLESFGPSIPNHPPGGRPPYQKPASFGARTAVSLPRIFHAARSVPSAVYSFSFNYQRLIRLIDLIDFNYAAKSPS